MKKSFLKRKRQSTDMVLQITSMADIFMILLVFLLKNYSTSITNLAPTTQISLPAVTKGNAQVKDTLKVEISSDSVVVDTAPVARLRNFEFSGEPDPAISGSVYAALAEQRKHLPEPNLDSALVVMADQNAPYSTVKRVVASAAKAGFVDLQLVVVETE
jgi:biopolymer transport protein ExbD